MSLSSRLLFAVDVALASATALAVLYRVSRLADTSEKSEQSVLAAQGGVLELRSAEIVSNDALVETLQSALF